MKFVLIILAIIAGLYFTFHKKVQAYDGAPYISVYGRKSFGNTQQMIKYLKAQSLPFQYFPVDDRKTADQLHINMRKAGLKTARYYLPVIEVNKQFFANPEAEKVKAVYYGRTY